MVKKESFITWVISKKKESPFLVITDRVPSLRRIKFTNQKKLLKMRLINKEEMLDLIRQYLLSRNGVIIDETGNFIDSIASELGDRYKELVDVKVRKEKVDTISPKNTILVPVDDITYIFGWFAVR